MANGAPYSAPSSDFVLIKDGSFTMGSPENEDWRSNDEVHHRVTVASFYMSKYEVTQKLWREVTAKIQVLLQETLFRKKALPGLKQLSFATL